MWVLFARAPPPDAPYWPGRRWLAAVDAVLWPAIWMVLAAKMTWSSGIVGLLMVTWAMWSAAARVHRAIALNHRYRFTTWRWGRVLLGLMLFGALLKFASPL